MLKETAIHSTNGIGIVTAIRVARNAWTLMSAFLILIAEVTACAKIPVHQLMTSMVADVGELDVQAQKIVPKTSLTAYLGITI